MKNQILHECVECCELGTELDGVGPVKSLQNKVLCDACLESHIDEIMESIPTYEFFDSIHA